MDGAGRLTSPERCETLDRPLRRGVTRRSPGGADTPAGAYIEPLGERSMQVKHNGRGRNELTEAQADGLACVDCGTDLCTVHASQPVGRSTTGSQVFACTDHRPGQGTGSAATGGVA